ncbi:MAG: TraR/DksA C4-type zinc finger protein [Alphaproteobacteria bacterium]|nr:TraR/DksA C4-type zinc finger protein [Alphaproteobacteria bacterium]
MPNIDKDEFRALLHAREAELRALSEISAEARGAVELDQASIGRVSRIDAIQQQAMALANERSRAQEMERIKSALVRLDDDEYGYCLVCGDEIPQARLRFDPSIATCVACAK